MIAKMIADDSKGQEDGTPSTAKEGRVSCGRRGYEGWIMDSVEVGLE